MNFRDATSALLSEGFRIPEIARAVSASEASVRAARQPEDAEGYRKPPKGWEAPLAALASARVGRLKALAQRIDGSGVFAAMLATTESMVRDACRQTHVPDDGRTCATGEAKEAERAAFLADAGAGSIPASVVNSFTRPLSPVPKELQTRRRKG